ncbi:Glucose 1-dehydrogenase [Halotydeus destructor]|nr:Glucose 1-dehydrogenase [Halotydeus destructor]
MDSKTFEGKVVLVTGAASGIGEATAIRFASLGASVVLADRNQHNLETVRRKCAEVGSDDNVLIVVADLTLHHGPVRMVEETIAKFGRLDVLVNNAGIYQLAKLEDADIMDIYDRTYAINIRAVVHLCHLALPHLEKTKGNIVNVSSVGGLRPWVNGLIYNSTKAALDMTTRCLALELGPKGIRINNVNPAVVRTPLYDTLDKSKEEVDTFFQAVASSYPLGRPGKVEDITKSITFLASDDASFISGHTLVIDGASIDSGDGILPGGKQW